MKTSWYFIFSIRFINIKWNAQKFDVNTYTNSSYNCLRNQIFLKLKKFMLKKKVVDFNITLMVPFFVGYTCDRVAKRLATHLMLINILLEYNPEICSIYRKKKLSSPHSKKNA